ncbi:hypothetical protein [Ornithinibacillus halophilus]|uniref:Uncharacterized protein n=1 Tax=Ornithinibacillus halophilus TaxID=930117 RepID=A0A1M5GQQ7_9BACI|nr:hypothetical protein [Ornithinibacillus halophilus]SHG06130.1 hypothetical protein SAMN05216225_101419 [Ornithinibacillus halophilus]
MNSFYFALIQILLILTIVGLLKLANYKKQERYKQSWVLYLAVAITAGVLLLDQYLITYFYEWLAVYFPQLIDYLLVFFNYAILVVFLTLKMLGKWFGRIRNFLLRIFGFKSNGIWMKLVKPIFRLLPMKLQQKLAKRDPKSVAFVYQRTASGIVLKPEWSFAYYLTLFTSLVPFGFFLFYVLNAVYHWISPVNWGLPEYPILSFILLIEIAWFFGGRWPEVKEGSISGEDAHTKKVAQYENLYEEYKRQFDKRILTSDAIVTDIHGDYKEFSVLPYRQLGRELDENSELVSYLCERLNKREKIVRDEYIQIVSNLLDEEHLLIENPNYDDLSPFLFTGIHQLLIKGKKMMVIANDDTELAAIQQWFKTGFKEEAEGFQYIWQIETLENAMERNINADILVVTPAQLLLPSFFQYFKNNVDLTEYEVVLIPEASKILSKYDTILHAFIWKLQDHLNKMPQQIILSKWYEALGEEVRDVLRIKPKNISISLDKSPNLFYMVWKK